MLQETDLKQLPLMVKDDSQILEVDTEKDEVTGAPLPRLWQVVSMEDGVPMSELSQVELAVPNIGVMRLPKDVTDKEQSEMASWNSQ